MQRLYYLLGRLLFPRQQDWEQRKNAKTILLTVTLALASGLFMAEVMRIIYNHKK